MESVSDNHFLNKYCSFTLVALDLVELRLHSENGANPRNSHFLVYLGLLKTAFSLSLADTKGAPEVSTMSPQNLQTFQVVLDLGWLRRASVP